MKSFDWRLNIVVSAMSEIDHTCTYWHVVIWICGACQRFVSNTWWSKLCCHFVKCLPGFVTSLLLNCREYSVQWLQSACCVQRENQDIDAILVCQINDFDGFMAALTIQDNGDSLT